MGKTIPWQKITPLNDLHEKEDISSTQGKKIEKIEKVIKNPPMKDAPETLEKSGIETLNSSMTPHRSSCHPINSKSDFGSLRQSANHLSLSFNEETTVDTHDSMKNNTSDYSDSLKKYLSDSKPQDETSPVVHSSMGGKFSLSSINQDLIFINKKSIQYCEDSLKSAKNDCDLVTLEIDKLKIEIDKEQKNVDNLIQYLLPMRQGKEVSCVLDEFGYQPEDEITLKTGEKIKAKDYTGEITHKVKIEKNFILIDEKEALTYDTRAKMWR